VVGDSADMIFYRRDARAQSPLPYGRSNASSLEMKGNLTNATFRKNLSLCAMKNTKEVDLLSKMILDA
jgi:hypothetical protein